MKKPGNLLLRDKIENHILELIRKQKLPGGFRLPAEREIGRLFRASQIPVRQATQSLINQGVLIKKPGKGTFVKKSGIITTDRIAVLHGHSHEGFFNSSFYMAILAGIESRAHRERKALLIRSLLFDAQDDPNRLFGELVDEVDGFILLDPFMPLFNRITQTLRDLEKPAVVLNCDNLPADVDSVVTSSRENTRMIINYLIGLGHRRIACITGSTRTKPLGPNDTNKIKGYKEALEENHITPDPQLLRPLDEDGNARENLLPHLLGLADPPTAVFCTGSHMVFNYFYPQAARLGLKIPDDLSFAGYDYLRDCDLVFPRLTSTETQLGHMGVLGVQRLLDKRAEKTRDAERHYSIVLPGTLCLRESQKKIV
jgi:LacI family transcriptional regulator